MKRKKKPVCRTYFVCTPEVQGKDNWYEVDAYSAFEAAERAMHEEMPSFEMMEMFGGSDSCFKVLVKKSEKSKVIEEFEVRPVIDLSWDVEKVRKPKVAAVGAENAIG